MHFFQPAECNVFAETGDGRHRSWFKVADVKVRERVVDEAMHGPHLAVHVLVDQARDEIWREGDDKGLQWYNTR